MAMCGGCRRVLASLWVGRLLQLGQIDTTSFSRASFYPSHCFETIPPQIHHIIVSEPTRVIQQEATVQYFRLQNDGS